MKLVTFSHAGFTRLGVVTSENEVVDLNYAYQALLESKKSLRAELIAEAFVPADMKGFLEGGNESLSLINEIVDYAINHRDEFKHPLVHAFNDVKLEAPVQNPGKIICVGHNYREHILEMGRELPDEPVIFAKFSNTLISPQDDIPFFLFLNSLIMKQSLPLSLENGHVTYQEKTLLIMWLAIRLQMMLHIVIFSAVLFNGCKGKQ